MADKVNNITTRFTADVSSFLKDTQSMKRGIAQANAEFKNATAGMDKWQGSTEGLQAKLTQLNKVVQIEKKRLADMVAEYEELEKAGKANTAQAQRLATQILNQGAKVKRAEADIAKYEKSLDEMGDEAKKGGKEVKDLGDKAKESGDGFTVAKGAIAGFIANGLTALASAAKNAISSVLGLADATREYRTNSAKLQTSFEAAGHSAETAKDTYTELYGVLGDDGQATEAAQHMAELASSEEDLTKLTNGLTGVYAKFGASLPLESLTEAANESAKVGKVTGSLADAINWTKASSEDWSRVLGGNDKALKAFNKAIKEGETTEDAYSAALAACSTEQERQSLIANTLNGLYGEQAEAFKETNKNVIDANKAQAEFAETQAEMGAKIEPITTKIREGFTRILEKILELVEGVDFEAFGAKIDSAFDTFVNDIMPKIVDGLTWIIDNKDIIIAGIVGIGAAFAAFKVVTLIQSVIGALKGMTVAQAALNLVMSMNPIGLVVAAIAGLVAAFVMLWKNCDGFREFWINLWENIKKACSAAWKAIVGFFKNAWESIKKAWSSATKWFSNVWSGIKNAFSAVGSWFGNIFRKAWNGVKSAWSGAKSFFSGIWSGIKNVFKSVSSWFGNIFRSAWSAIKNAFSGVASFFGGIWDKIVSTFKSVGTKVAQAIGGAFKSAINSVIGTVERAINVIPNTINKAIGAINKLPNVNISKMSTISLPRLAKGGIVDKATIAQIGEAGREAVIPLERNTQGLKEIARMVAEEISVKNGGGVTVNNYNTFSGMTTTRYALHRAEKQGIASWKLLMAQQGGV